MQWWRRDRKADREYEAHRARVREAIRAGEAHVGRERDVYELMRSAAGDDLEGWEQIGDGAWTRPLADGIRKLIRLRAMKGTTYRLYWGLSLAWVPHFTSTSTSLHRTAKSARLDLFEGHDDDARVSFDWGDGGAVIWLPEDLERAWRIGFERAGAFFARATDTEAVLALAEEQLEDDWAMTVHVPSPLYVATFTLAYLGRETDARAALEREISKFYLHLPDSHTRADAPQKLEAALERILRGS